MVFLILGNILRVNRLLSMVTSKNDIAERLAGNPEAEQETDYGSCEWRIY